MSQMIRVIVNGAKGRMGSEAVNAIHAEPDLELAAQIDLGDDLAQAIKTTKADVVVDFTRPDCVLKNVHTIIEQGVGGVVGTTGFSPAQITELTQRCEGRSPAILIAPNFAIGALLMMHCAQIVAKFMPKAEIIEFHHDKKLDAPSGTAVKTAELIAKASPETIVPRETFEIGPRGDLFFGIPVHSVRLPGLLAHQEVIFGAEGQTLTLRHDSISRGCFMPGVVLSCREVMKRTGLIYGLDTILFE
ncbi:MAG: 4-hydroxy-tetrahydrodipicolinate reductase [bacterium]|jgi:4-hydroxy-tetrahydrodipicolinate reductase|nr:4-hydroxy-tetrahydrodipicolinate reductase [bacterium]